MHCDSAASIARFALIRYRNENSVPGDRPCYHLPHSTYDFRTFHYPAGTTTCERRGRAWKSSCKTASKQTTGLSKKQGPGKCGREWQKCVQIVFRRPYSLPLYSRCMLSKLFCEGTYLSSIPSEPVKHPRTVQCIDGAESMLAKFQVGKHAHEDRGLIISSALSRLFRCSARSSFRSDVIISFCSPGLRNIVIFRDWSLLPQVDCFLGSRIQSIWTRGWHFKMGSANSRGSRHFAFESAISYCHLL